MRIAFDIDGCLANFTKSYAKLITEVSGRDLVSEETIANPETWYWDRAAGYTKDEEKATWKRIMGDGTFWASLEPFDRKVFDRIDLFSQNHPVYFLTNRDGKRAKQQTEEWLQTYGILHPTVLLSADKVPVLKGLAIDVFVDDKPETLADVAAALPDVKLFKVAYRYNVDAPGESVASVSEMLNRLGL